jgi:hypothetical protein
MLLLPSIMNARATISFVAKRFARVWKTYRQDMQEPYAPYPMDVSEIPGLAEEIEDYRRQNQLLREAESYLDAPKPKRVNQIM